jgi:maltodextrin utilization protein YvdJ
MMAALMIPVYVAYAKKSHYLLALLLRAVVLLTNPAAPG